jgi:hypothetical protein
MYLVAPDILADACGLSLPLIVLACGSGLALWLFGWWSHRFWVVLITTILGGVFGLYEAAAFQAQPVVASVLLAVAAGMLALALVRLLAFLAGGLAGLLLIQAVYPALNQPLIGFVSCGLVCLLLFRLCMMALTSFSGALLLHYATLMLLNHYGVMDAVAWTGQAGTLVNWTCGGTAFAGFAFQFSFDRWRRRKDREDKSRTEEVIEMLTGWTGGESSRAA